MGCPEQAYWNAQRKADWNAARVGDPIQPLD